MIYPVNYLPAYHPAANARIGRNRRNLKKTKKRLGLERIKVLDVGCGMSYFLFDFSLHIRGFEGYGLDMKKEIIDFVKKISERNKLNLTFKTGSGYDIPFPEESFHLVICNHVLEHVKNPERVLRECHRVLKKNGELWIGVPSKKDNPIPKISRIFGGVEPEDHVTEGFEKAEIKTMLEKGGFEVVEIIYEYPLFGKIITDITGILGEFSKISMEKTIAMKPYYSKSVWINLSFNLKVLFAKMLAFIYNFDLLLKDFRGIGIISKGVKP
jgi:2-polyprenyl-3-methyl-5-hydroxy-6-metoxy-1,4-benzoquinol methylase